MTLAGAQGSLARGLTASTAVPDGTGVLRVPWTAALTADTALIRLKHLEATGSGGMLAPVHSSRCYCWTRAGAHRRAAAGLLPRGLQHFLDLSQSKSDELPQSCAWTCLLALHLLADMRDPGTTLLPYIQLLPSPPGTMIKAVCSKGPDANDLLLFR